jgi:hypothetical protein
LFYHEGKNKEGDDEQNEEVPWSRKGRGGEREKGRKVEEEKGGDEEQSEAVPRSRKLQTNDKSKKTNEEGFGPIIDYQAPSTDHQSPITELRAPSTDYRVPSTEYRAPNSRNLNFEQLCKELC